MLDAQTLEPEVVHGVEEVSLVANLIHVKEEVVVFIDAIGFPFDVRGIDDGRTLIGVSSCRAKKGDQSNASERMNTNPVLTKFDQ